MGQFMGYTVQPPKNAVVAEFTNQNGETRYIILNGDTGETFDDAQGYGYKSEEKARNAFAYACKKREIYGGGTAWR